MPHINKNMLSFFLTTKCNLRCVYCYNSEERARLQEQSLPLNIALAGVDHYFSNNNSRHIRFYGPGEPTQEFGLMRDITDYARRRSADSLIVEIQTNGVFSEKICEWIADNVSIVWVSFDGTPNIQDKNRPLSGGTPSSPIIERNVKWLSNQQTKGSIVGARVTITDDNINKQKELVDYFYDLGIRYIWTDPLFPTVGNIPVCNDELKKSMDHFDFHQYIDNYTDAHNYAASKNVFYGSFLACNFDGKTNMHCRACLPAPHLTTDGYISACDMVTFGKDANHMDCFVYGKWDVGLNKFIFDESKIETLQNRNLKKLPHCSNCIAKDYCGGYCLGEITNETGDMFGCKPQVCEAIVKLYKLMGPYPSSYKFLHP